MNRERVPVVVLSGGLGSGKTTLLNHLLRRGVGRVGVVVNDFGAVNVDAMLVGGQVDATAEISGGCLCCLADPSDLDDVLAMLSGADVDVIVLEASGLAEPRSLARMVVATQAPGVRFGGVIELVDVAAWVEADQAHNTALPGRDALRVASVIIVNKTDRVPAEAVTRLEAAVREHAGSTPVIRTAYGQVAPELLFDAATRGEVAGQLSLADLIREDAATRQPHDHEHHESVSVSSDRAVDPLRLVDWLESRPAGVYRVKGLFQVADDPRRYVVQAVGSWVAFERDPWPDDQAPVTALVAIGAGIDTEATELALRECLTDAAPTGPQRRRFERYVQVCR